MKQLARLLGGWCCRAGRVLAHGERCNRGRLTILTYHRVLPRDRKGAYFAPGLVVTPEAFRHHCRTVAQNFHVLSLSEALDVWCQRPFDRRPIAALTFDDGYRDNYEYAAPILAEFGLWATFFVIAGLIGTSVSPWYDQMGRAFGLLRQQRRMREMLARPAVVELLGGCARDGGVSTAGQLIAVAKTLGVEKRQVLLDELRSLTASRQDYVSSDLIMSWRQLAELADAGHEIGCHSWSHEILPQLDDTRREAEVSGSRRLLEERLGNPVRAFCYPNGDFDEHAVRMVNAAGYTCAVTSSPGCNEPGQDRYRLKRWFIHEDRLAGPLGRPSATLLRMELCGMADRVFDRRRRGTAFA